MRRHPWLRALLLVLLVAVPILEVWLLIQVGQRIGILWTIAILVFEAILGAWLLRREGAKAWKALNAALRTGVLPAGELADAALVLVGGVLLMLPGFATDVVGFVFLLPITRPLARGLLSVVVARQVSQLGLPMVPPGRPPEPRSGSGVVIEGEAVDLSEPEEARPPRRSRRIGGE